MPKIKKCRSLQGQALIIILLVMSVVMTVVLASASRSVTEIQTTSYEEEALRAFSAAEAGVEEKLLNLGTVGGGPQSPVPLTDSSASYVVEVKDHNITGDDDGKQISYPKKLSSGETATFWFVSQDNNGLLVCDSANKKPCWYVNNASNKIFVCYGSIDSSPSAVEISFYYDNSLKSVDYSFGTTNENNYADVNIVRLVFEDKDENKIPGSFDAKEDDDDCIFDDGTKFKYKAIIDAGVAAPGTTPSPCYNTPGCLLFAKVRMLYGVNQPVGMHTPVAIIPSQGILISSEGTAGESTRKVEVYQGHPEPLDLFDTAVFSLNGLSK